MRILNGLATAILAFPCTALYADTIDYLFTGTNVLCLSGCQVETLEFQLPSQPAIVQIYDDSFRTRDFSIIQNTTGAYILPPSADFPVSEGGFVFTAGSSNFVTLNYPGLEFFFATNLTSLFGGPLNSPTLLTGSSLTQVGYGTVDLYGPLTITDISSSPVPEPSSLALLGTGLVGIVGGIRARRSRAHLV